MKKYWSDRKGRRNFDTALHYNAVDMIATEKTNNSTQRVAGSPGRWDSAALRCGILAGVY